MRALSSSPAPAPYVLCALAGLLLAACQPEVPAAPASADAPERTGDPRFVFRDPLPTVAYPDDAQPPTVTMVWPADGTSTTSAGLLVTGSATDDLGIAALTIQAGPNVAVPAGTPALDGGFAIPVTLVPGPQAITVRAYDIAGNVGVATATVTRTLAEPDTGLPTVTILSPDNDFAISAHNVWVEGTTSDDVGIVSVTVAVADGAPEPAQTADGWVTWVHQAALPSGGAAIIEVAATDAAGHVAHAWVSGSTTFLGDAEPPALTISTPADGFVTAAGEVLVTGTAADASGIASVDVRVDAGPYQAVTTADGWATWELLVPLVPGDNVIKARAVDGSGLVSTTSVTVLESSGEAWGPPHAMTLKWAPADHSLSTFQLDKGGLGEIIGPGVAEQILMLELDVRPLVESTLDTIRDSCGAGWWIPNDLEDTCPASWGQAEINLWRLVTMTPANVRVEGTSIEGMAEIADVLSTFGLLDDFDVVLAAGLGIGVYDLIVEADAVTDSLVDNLLSTHPNVLPGGLIPVTMADGLSDMATLGPRFDAVGSHPGFLDGQSPTSSEVLTDDFAIFMAATSNVHWHDGVDLDGGSKVYLPLLDDQTGPTFDDALEFDFLDPATFWVEGLAAAPKVDLAFKIDEYDYWVSAGTSPNPLPYGNGEAWVLDPWLVEPILADAAYRAYETHRSGCDLCGGSGSGALLWEDPLFGLDETELVVGRHGYDKDGDGQAEHFSFISPNPPGWLRIWTLFGMGSPPAPQYVWDMILEVSERRLLDGGVAQGQGDVRFEVQGVDVGITAPEIKAALRPTMEAQKSKLSELLLGETTVGVTPPDLYLARGADAKLRLYFVHPSDGVEAGAADHLEPGFYADEALSAKLSSTLDAGSGDATHEKLLLGDAAQTVYCQDVSGAVYRLELQPLEGGDSVPLTVRKRLAPGATP